MAKIRQFSAFVAIMFILSLQTFSSSAQNPSSYYIEDPRTFYGGIIAGTNFSQVDGDAFAGYHKVGLNIGGIMYAHLAERLALSMELLFSQKGSRLHMPQENLAKSHLIHKYLIQLNYAEIPLQITYFDRRKTHFGAGISYSRLISSNEIIETNPSDPNLLSLDYPFRKDDLNFVVGGNLHLWKGFFVNLRFQYSVFSIRKDFPPG